MRVMHPTQRTLTRHAMRWVTSKRQLDYQLSLKTIPTCGLDHVSIKSRLSAQTNRKHKLNSTITKKLYLIRALPTLGE